jgi:hypothetical protein
VVRERRVHHVQARAGRIRGVFPDVTAGPSRKGKKMWRGLNGSAFAEYTATQAQGAVLVPRGTRLHVARVVG